MGGRIIPDVPVRGVPQTDVRYVNCFGLKVAFEYTAPGQVEVGCQPGISRGEEYRAIDLTSGIFDRGENVFAFDARIVFENLVEASARARQVENIGHAYAHSTDAGATATLGVVNGDSRETGGGHGICRTFYRFPASAGATYSVSVAGMFGRVMVRGLWPDQGARSLNQY